MKVKILGAGSIGNHMAHASRALGWAVDICDVDANALERTKTQIFPARYSTWDEEIRLYLVSEAPAGVHDLIIIGTPPDTHIELAREMIHEKPTGILVEKPFCQPDLNGLEELLEEANQAGIKFFVGYDHVLGDAANEFCKILRGDDLGQIETLDVEFREHWGGIFAAHPWLAGPADSYLGYSSRGGGASGEHSHAINLWQHFALAIGAGRVVEVQASMSFERDGIVEYDKLCFLNLKTENGFCGRVVQDVVTEPSRKWARVQGNNGYAEWYCGMENNTDRILHGGSTGNLLDKYFEKTRPDDFITELKHIQSVLKGQISFSDISVQRGAESMLVIAAAHKSAELHRSVQIDYSCGFNLDAVK